MAYHSKFTGKQVDDILDAVAGKQDQLSETNQVEKGWIAERAVEGKNVAQNAITTSKIKDGNITTEKIKPLAITGKLLSAEVQGKLVAIYNFSTADIANWSGATNVFQRTFGYALPIIIKAASVQPTRVTFKYNGKTYTAYACCATPLHAVQSVSFLIHNAEGLTELISMNLDNGNVTVTNETLGGGLK